MNLKNAIAYNNFIISKCSLLNATGTIKGEPHSLYLKRLSIDSSLLAILLN